MNRAKKVSLMLLAASQVAMFSGAARANECLTDRSTGNKAAVGKKDSWAIERQHASTTWQDWIWRGTKAAGYCEGPHACGYHYTKTITTGYSYTVGVELGLGGIPVIGGVLGLVTPSGNYQRRQEMSTAFSIDTTYDAGWSIYPVQAVIRQWVSGNFRGMDVNTGQGCSQTIGSSGNGHIYRWDGNRTFGNWSANKEVAERWILHSVRGQTN